MVERNVNEVQPLSLRLPRDLYETLKRFAGEKGFTMTHVVNMAVRSYVRNWRDDVEGKRRDQSKQWASGWPKNEPCPGCAKSHEPAEHPAGSLAAGRVTMVYAERELDNPYE